MSTGRRTQQLDLYGAERTAPKGVRFNSQAEIQAFIDELVDTPWWPERFPKVRTVSCPTVARRNGEGSVGAWFADDWTGQIEMHQLHWNQLYVCHELAHVCAAPLESTGHDPIFARIYLELVYRVMGLEVWTELRSSFVQAGICFTPKCMTEGKCGCE